jgi:hypothetical protein
VAIVNRAVWRSGGNFTAVALDRHRDRTAAARQNVVEVHSNTGDAEPIGVAHNARVSAVAFSPAGPLAALFGGGAVVVYDTEVKHEIAMLGHGFAVHAMQFLGSGDRFATVCEDRQLRVWAVETGKNDLWIDHPAVPTALGASRSGEQVVTGCRNGSVHVWEGDLRRASVKLSRDAVTTVAIDADAGVFAAGDDRGRVGLWDLDGAGLALEAVSAGPIVTVGFADGELLAVAADGTLRRGDEVMSLSTPVAAATLSTDGRRLLTCEADTNDVCVWDATTGDARGRLPHEGRVTDIRLDDTGDRAVTTATDALRLWRLDEPAPRPSGGGPPPVPASGPPAVRAGPDLPPPVAAPPAPAAGAPPPGGGPASSSPPAAVPPSPIIVTSKSNSRAFNSSPDGDRTLWRRPRARIALAGYATLAVLGLGYLVARLLGATVTEGAIVGGLVAAPLLVALIGDRVRTVKAFSFELTLAEVAVEPDRDVALAVAQTASLGGSGPAQLQEPILQAMRRPEEARLVELDLGEGRSWKSRQLFLVAALLEDYTAVERIMLLADKRYVGMASPGVLHRALAQRFPEFEATYRSQRAQGKPAAAETEFLRILTSWAPPMPPPDVEWVSPADAPRWLPLETASISLEPSNRPAANGRLDPLLRFQINAIPQRYVPLLDGDRLHIVDREELAARTTDGVLRDQLSAGRSPGAGR